tara:strand:- start:184 stop:363 length:180 start_codon:yes stop_codon:yes gene_type:complete
MNEYARGITTVNFGGTFVMSKNDDNNNFNEGQTLLLTMALLVGITVLLNGCAEIFIRIL